MNENLNPNTQPDRPVDRMAGLGLNRLMQVSTTWRELTGENFIPFVMMVKADNDGVMKDLTIHATQPIPIQVMCEMLEMMLKGMTDQMLMQQGMPEKPHEHTGPAEEMPLEEPPEMPQSPGDLR
jgi:hypothetical protein